MHLVTILILKEIIVLEHIIEVRLLEEPLPCFKPLQGGEEPSLDVLGALEGYVNDHLVEEGIDLVGGEVVLDGLDVGGLLGGFGEVGVLGDVGLEVVLGTEGHRSVIFFIRIVGLGDREVGIGNRLIRDIMVIR